MGGLLLVVPLSGTAAGRSTSLLSVGSADVPGNRASGTPTEPSSPSTGGARTAFASQADNLVPGDLNGATPDIFVRDATSATTTIVSVDGLGRSANGPSRHPAISADGRFVAFESDASTLAAGDVNSVTDIFVRDLRLRTTTLVSRSTAGGLGTLASTWPSISSDGRYVAFTTPSALESGDVNGAQDVYVRDRDTDADGLYDEAGAVATRRASIGSAEPDGDSFTPALAPGGGAVAFASDATNLVAGDGNGETDVFVAALTGGVPGAPVRVSAPSGGGEADGPSLLPAISGDGSTIAFESLATNLAGTDANLTWDVYVVRPAAGSVVRLSAGSPEPNGASGAATISADGSVVGFASVATNLATGDTNGAQDVFVAPSDGSAAPDRVLGGAGQGDAATYAPALTPDGAAIVYHSVATNLVTGDLNAVGDVFVTALAGTCASGADESGALTGVLHGVEGSAGPARGATHAGSCALAGAGL